MIMKTNIKVSSVDKIYKHYVRSWTLNSLVFIICLILKSLRILNIAIIEKVLFPIKICIILMRMRLLLLMQFIMNIK